MSQNVTLGAGGIGMIGTVHNIIQVGSIWERAGTGVLESIKVLPDGADQGDMLQVHFHYRMVSCSTNSSPGASTPALRQERRFCDKRSESNFHLQGWARILEDRNVSLHHSVGVTIVVKVGHKADGQERAEALLDKVLPPTLNRPPCSLEAEVAYDRIYAWGVVLDKEGRLLIADNGKSRILRVRPGATRGEVMFGGKGQGSDLDQLHDPAGIALDGEGRLLIADYGNSRILSVILSRVCTSFDWPDLLPKDGGLLAHSASSHEQYFSVSNPLWASDSHWKHLFPDGLLHRLLDSPLPPSRNRSAGSAALMLESLKLPSAESSLQTRGHFFVPLLAIVVGMTFAIHASGSRLALGIALTACFPLLLSSYAALEIAASATTPPDDLGQMLQSIKFEASAGAWRWLAHKTAAATITVLFPWAIVPLYMHSMADGAPVSCEEGMLWEAHVHTLLGTVAASFAWALIMFERAREGITVPLPGFIKDVLHGMPGQKWVSSRSEVRRMYSLFLFLSVTNDWYNDSCFLLIGAHCQFRGAAISAQILAVAVAFQLVGATILSWHTLDAQRWRSIATVFLPPAWLQILDPDLAGVSDYAAVVRCFTEDLAQGSLQVWYVVSVASNYQVLFSLLTSLPLALAEAAGSLRRSTDRESATHSPRST